MPKTPSSLRTTALRGLTHPLCWLAVGLLLLNDHVLKRAAPSALTGKLSDFAGLFFFPFLAATIAGLFLDRRHPTPQWSAPLIFLLTGAWFAAIKTLPWANALTVSALAQVVPDSQIVLDPTDLIALAALWPAWRLWRRLESEPGPAQRQAGPAQRQAGPAQRQAGPSRRQAVFALALASLATMATTCAPISHVKRVMVFDDRFYAGISERRYGNEASSIIAKSDDEGKTWQAVALENAPQEVVEAFQQPATLPVTVCDPQAPQTCYRVSGAEIVEGSTDGGQTWNVIWEIPKGRRKFAEKYLSSPPGPCGKGFDFGPYDLAMLPTANGTVLVAATSSEGVLVRGADGQWQRYGVLKATPTPFVNPGIGPVLGEAALLVVLALLTWMLATPIAWSILLARSHTADKASAWKNIVPALVGIILTALVGGVLYTQSSLISQVVASEYLFPILLASPVLALIGVGLSWWGIRRSIAAPEAVTLAQWTCNMVPLGIILAGFPFLLWTSGAIAVYEVALGITLFLALGVLVAGVVLLNQVAQLVSASAPQEMEASLEPTDGSPDTSQPAKVGSEFFLLAWVIAYPVSSMANALYYVAMILNAPWTLYASTIIRLLILSGLQWAIIRHYHRILRWWAPATLIGALAGMLTKFIVSWLLLAVIPSGEWGNLILAGIAGAVAGIGQWLLLRRCFKRAGWWVLANAVSAALNALTTLPGLQFLGWGTFLAESLITGATFMWLAQQPQEVSEEQKL
ncbi:MAG: hypothetical protein JXA21_29830 [Anaerolineae bacterium]|nr:hypothetical protein [Anaerolineae bacterium]